MDPNKMIEYSTTSGHCDCKAFRFKRGQKPCKHIKALKSAIALVKAAGLKVSPKA